MSHFDDDKTKGYKLFIGGLHLNTTTDGLRDFYSQWGDIIDAVVMKDPLTKRSRGFGFVTYADQESVDKCMDNRPHVVDGREVEAKLAVPKEESTPAALTRTKKVFLGGLHLETTEDEIRDVLLNYGDVEEIVIKTDPDTNKPRGFGFAILNNFDAVDKLCHERYIKIHDRDVEVKKAQSAEELRRKDTGRMQQHHPSSHGPRDRGYDHMGRMNYGREPYGSQYPGYPGYGYPRYPTDYYRSDPYMGMAGAYPYGDRSGMYASYRQAYDNAAAANQAYGMYSSYGAAASGYGPMRGYGGGGGGAGGGDMNGAYSARNTAARIYHPYKR